MWLRKIGRRGRKMTRQQVADGIDAGDGADLITPGTKMLVGPGAGVSVQINAPGSPDPNFVSDLKLQVTALLKKADMKIVDNAPAILTIGTKVEATGDAGRLRPVGTGGQERIFPLKQITMTLSLTDKTGRTCIVKDVAVTQCVFAIEEKQLTDCEQK